MTLPFTGRQTRIRTEFRLQNLGNSDIWNIKKMEINKNLVLRRFALTTLVNLHIFLIFALCFSV
jgi:hypothetical protein